MRTLIHVAVGVVINSQQQILIAKRPDTAHQGGLWEFPGGKIEKGEKVIDALFRELQEEVNLRVTNAEFLMDICHDYGDKQVLLDVWLCKDFVGDAVGNENQEIKWIRFEELRSYTFPSANQAIIDTLLGMVSEQTCL
jgi:8-oxo-dGTP diphosphatase